MTARFRSAWLVLLCLLCALSWPSAAQQFDPDHTRFGFEVRTRWGQRVGGEFPRYEGEVVRLADGRRQVRIRLAAGAVEVADSPRYTALARGEGFFDAARHPQIEFVSEPITNATLIDGGALRGRCSIHGISRTETFVLRPSACAQPGIGCDVVAHGNVRREDYGLDGWQFALRNQVRFDLRVRLREEQP